MTFVPDTASLNRFLHSPNGQLARYMERTADRVVIEAEGLAPVGDGKNGHLFQSIHRTGLRPTSDGLSIRVGSEKRYAAAVVLGSKPHVILPNKASVLSFTAKDGSQVFTQRVNHPGTKANNFLMRAAQRMIHGA